MSEPGGSRAWSMPHRRSCRQSNIGLTRALSTGMLEGGVEGTVKHFPGLGRIRSNTDFSSTGITDRVATADDPFLQPFADGIAAGAGLVMMASARYPKLDDDNPAMFSEKIVTGLLQWHLESGVRSLRLVERP